MPLAYQVLLATKFRTKNSHFPRFGFPIGRFIDGGNRRSTSSSSACSACSRGYYPTSSKALGSIHPAIGPGEKASLHSVSPYKQQRNLVESANKMRSCGLTKHPSLSCFGDIGFFYLCDSRRASAILTKPNTGIGSYVS
jgi:hypothetical protein